MKIDYGKEIEEEAAKAGKYPSRWLAIKLLEGDEDLLREVEEAGAEAVLAQLAASNQRLRAVFGDGVEAIAERRYGFISGLLKEVVSRRSTVGNCPGHLLAPYVRLAAVEHGDEVQYQPQVFFVHGADRAKNYLDLAVVQQVA